MEQGQVLREALERMPLKMSEHPTGTLVLKGKRDVVLIFRADQGWRVKWPSGTTEDYMDVTRMTHKVLKWSWTHGTKED